MVNIGHKTTSERQAKAQGVIYMEATTLERIQQGQVHKGNVLEVARLAGLMAVKKTADLIPLCHPVMLTHAQVTFECQTTPPSILCQVMAHTQGQTGVEMEALLGVQIALLTIYDMCKAIDRGMTLSHIQLLTKEGGKSGRWVHPNPYAPTSC
jgi:cyclic pyranopterin phosphate synthase